MDNHDVGEAPQGFGMRKIGMNGSFFGIHRPPSFMALLQRLLRGFLEFCWQFPIVENLLLKSKFYYLKHSIRLK